MIRNVTFRIKELLQQKGMSQKDLATKTGITESAISHYVKGDRVPRGIILVKIAQALETTTDFLLNDTTEPNKEQDLILAKSLIARNAANMTKQEQIEFLTLLLGVGGPNET